MLCFSCVLLSGCNSSDDLITKFYMEKLDTNGKYNEYMRLKEENKLDKTVNISVIKVKQMKKQKQQYLLWLL